MKKFSLFAVLALLLGAGYFFIFTPQGVSIIFGLFNYGATPYESSDYPTEITGTKAVLETIQMPAAIQQASGIDFDSDKEAFFLVTDQAEIMELSADLQTIRSSAVILDRPPLFRQGLVESAHYYDDKLYIGGELGGIVIWEKSAETWEKLGMIEIPAEFGSEVEVDALAINPENGHIYMAGGDEVIKVMDQDGAFITNVKLQMPTKPERSISEYLIGGMDFYDGVLYIVTEYHSAVLAVDPSTGNITSVSALDGTLLGSGLTVTEDKFYVVVDHELGETLPGVKVYQRK